MEACGIFVQELSRVMTSPVRFFLHSPWMCLHALDGQPAPRLPDPTRTAMRRKFPPAPSLPSLDADPGNRLFPFNAAAEKEESDFDRFIFRLTFFLFFFIYLRISVYLLGRTLSSPMEATTEPWKTTKNKVCTKKNP